MKKYNYPKPSYEKKALTAPVTGSKRNIERSLKDIQSALQG